MKQLNRFTASRILTYLHSHPQATCRDISFACGGISTSVVKRYLNYLEDLHYISHDRNKNNQVITRSRKILIGVYPAVIRRVSREEYDGLIAERGGR